MIENEMYFISKPIKDKSYYINPKSKKNMIKSELSDNFGFLIIATTKKELHSEKVLGISKKDCKKIKKDGIVTVELKVQTWFDSFSNEYDVDQLDINKETNEVIIKWDTK